MACVNSNTMDIDSALSHLGKSQSGIISGGTDYYPGLNDGAPDRALLSVSHITGLDQIECIDGYWRIGAAVTWSQLIAAKLPPVFNCLKQAGREVGSVQIQNAASIVGNICNASPAADGVPALLVLGTHVELSSVDGVRVLPLQQFITGVRQTQRKANELVTALLIPENYEQDKSAFVKLGSRTYLVISIVMCSTRLRLDEHKTIVDAAVSIGACSPVACRLPEVERALIGQACTEKSVSACVTAERLSPLSPISDVRASAEYRLHAAKIMLQRQLQSLCEHAV